MNFSKPNLFDTFFIKPDIQNVEDEENFCSNDLEDMTNALNESLNKELREADY